MKKINDVIRIIPQKVSAVHMYYEHSYRLSDMTAFSIKIINDRRLIVHHVWRYSFCKFNMNKPLFRVVPQYVILLYNKKQIWIWYVLFSNTDIGVKAMSGIIYYTFPLHIEAYILVKWIPAYPRPGGVVSRFIETLALTWKLG